MHQKNYRRCFTYLIFCFLFFFISCGKKADDTENTKKQNNGSSGMSQELEGDGVAGTVLELKGKAFGSLTVVGEEDSVCCNLPENVTGWDAIVPICHDPLYDIMYYVDYGRDYKIYAIKDGVSEVVIEMSGKRLFCRRGKLYFLADTRGEFALPGAKSGNILSYDPVSGDITLISDQVFDSMVVFQDMIYCYQIIGERMGSDGIGGLASSEWFYFFHNAELLEKEKQALLTYKLNAQRYGKYFIAGVIEQIDPERMDMDEGMQALYERSIAAGYPPEQLRTATGLQLCNWDGTGNIFLENLDVSVIDFNYYVKGEDIIWLTSDNVYHTYNIPTGQETIKEAKIGKPPRILLNDIIYSADGTCADLESGTYENCKMAAPVNIIGVREMYTDGNTLYAIVNCTIETQTGGHLDKLLLFRMNYVSQGNGDTHLFSLTVLE